MITRKLDNGLTVVLQPMAHMRSVSMSLWVNTGSVRERGAEAGASHFIEHMVFKGTQRRSAEQIAMEMDAVGGSINACTSKECTCFYAKVLDEHSAVAADVLSDIVFSSTFDETEMNKEKGVVVEEILMCEDTPEDLVSETATALFFDEDPLAKPILGTQESVRAFTRDSLLAYKNVHYGAANTVVAVAGHFDPEKMFALIQDKFSFVPQGERSAPLLESYPGGRRIQCIKKDIEQVHITFALPGFARDTDGQFPLAVLSNIIGGGLSSRLFQNIREKRGLAYSVYSYPSSFTTTGSFSLYAGTGEKQALEVSQLMMEEIANLRENGVTEEEFVRCREQLKGNYLLGMESTVAVMDAIAKTALLRNREYNEQETLNRIECVTMEAIKGVLSASLDPCNLCAAFVGRVEGREEKFAKSIGI